MSAIPSDETIPSDGIERTVDRDFDGLQVTFLRDRVGVPSDNPPGDCVPHGSFAAERLEALGFAVERDVVPSDVPEQSGLRGATNLIVRRRFGSGTAPPSGRERPPGNEGRGAGLVASAAPGR